MPNKMKGQRGSNIILGWDMQGPPSDRTVFQGSSTNGRGSNRDPTLLVGQDPQYEAPSHVPVPRVYLPGPCSDNTIFKGSGTQGRGFDREDFPDPLAMPRHPKPSLTGLVTGDGLQEAPSDIVVQGLSANGRGFARDPTLLIDAGVPPAPSAPSEGLSFLLPADLIPTLIEWGGIGIIGFIGIIVLAQVTGAVQEELGPGGIMGMFGLGGRR